MSDWARTAAINALCDQESPDDTAPIESALRQARADALEEAASAIDSADPLLADFIRSLKDKQP